MERRANDRTEIDNEGQQAIRRSVVGGFFQRLLSSRRQPEEEPVLRHDASAGYAPDITPEFQSILAGIEAAKARAAAQSEAYYVDHPELRRPTFQSRRASDIARELQAARAQADLESAQYFADHPELRPLQPEAGLVLDSITGALYEELAGGGMRYICQAASQVSN